MKHIALVLALLMIVGSADAALTRTLKEIVKGGDAYDSSVKSVPVEDEDMTYSWPGLYPGDSAGGTGGSFVVGPETVWGPGTEYYCASLIGIADMINLLPNSTISGPDDIISATFRVRHRGPTGGEIIGVHAVTSPWLSAGAETTVTALHRVAGGEDPWWVADLGKVEGVDTDWVGFSAADYDPLSGAQFTITDTTRHYAHDIDITAIVKGWVAGGEYANQGLCMVWEATPEETEAFIIASGGNAPYFNSSEQNSSWDTLPDGSAPGPEFIITYAPEPVTIGLLAVGGLALLRRKR